MYTDSSACQNFINQQKLMAQKKPATTMTSWRVFLDLLGTLVFIKLLKKCRMQIELSHAVFFCFFLNAFCHVFYVCYGKNSDEIKIIFLVNTAVY